MRKPLIVLLVLVFVLVIGAFAATYKRWEGQPPKVAFDRDFKALGQATSLGLRIEDPDMGLKRVTIRLHQNNQEVALVDEWLERDAPKVRNFDVGKLIAEKYKIQDGPAALTVSVSDHALRNFLGGNRTEVAKDFVFDSQPPRLQVFEAQHYINQGGSECVVYRVSEDVEVSGVQIGPYFFPGYAADFPDKDVRFALFAVKYDLPPDTPMKVIARDAAGNQSTAEFWHKVFPKPFRSREIVLDDSFIQKVVPEIMAHTRDIKDQGDPLKTFVEINSKLRQANHETIVKLSRESQGQLLWNGAFLQLSNSKVESFFADRRTYKYQGKAVDQQDHVGFDLSVVMQYPIEAANDGRVILADYFGIYGNTVLIDHGTGLVSLYGHMSSIDVKPGQMVKKKDVLGKSGATGLAAGDHLHFGMFLHGVPVNATEWWDAKWVQDHVLDRLRPQ